MGERAEPCSPAPRAPSPALTGRAPARNHIVPWDYATLEGLAPDASRRLAAYLAENVPRSHFYLSIGLWARQGQLSPAALARSLEAALQGGATHVWVTPNDMLSDEHWSLLLSLWRNRPDHGRKRSPRRGGRPGTPPSRRPVQVFRGVRNRDPEPHQADNARVFW